MGKAFVIALMVIAIWVAVSVFTQGTDRAFGGLFAGRQGSPPAEAADGRSTPQRAADAFQRAYQESEDRVDRALGQPR